MSRNNSNKDVLDAAYDAWAGLAELRSRRDRNKRFTYGRQWDDPEAQSNGRVLTEYEACLENGYKPLTNNMMRQIIKTVVGRFRSLRNQRIIVNEDMADLYGANELDELDARALEEFLISGCAIQRVVSENRPDRIGVWVDNVNPSSFFVNRFGDPRGLDIEIIGQLHEMSLSEVIMRFSHGSQRKADRLRRIYTNRSAIVSPSAFYNATVGRCRVIEVWTLEAVERKRGAEKWGVDTRWQCRFLSPEGELLDSTISPYRHGGHPYVVKFYPLIDKEIHPFIEDIIDQQKYINRLVTMIDRVMGSSAKGVLLFPRNQLPEDLDWEQVSSIWSRSDSVLPYDPRPGYPGPQQVITSTSEHGAYQLLNLEMKLFENISGVGDALMGRSSNGITGQGMYESQVENATIALADIFDTFGSFVASRDRKMSGAMVK